MQMRNYDPTSEDDISDARECRARPWMLECLQMNPNYTLWGPYEDAMCEDGGWSGRLIYESWALSEFKNPDELNEIVNFYFYCERDSEICRDCDRTGLNPATKALADHFYAHHLASGLREESRWHDKITQDEVQALVDAGRLCDFTHSWIDSKWQRDERKSIPTAEEVNAWSTSGRGFGHDSINRTILIETRAKRLGVYGLCPKCAGKGSIYTADEARLGLVLWVLHPRKGCSRGVDIKHVRREDLPDVYSVLHQAAARNAERFSRIP